MPARAAELAGRSDATVRAATGRSWSQWVRTLDALAADRRPHREVAALLRERYGLSGWWAQTVTVGYERIRGLREAGQRLDGSYEVGRSRTVGVPVRRLYRAWSDARTRARWLPDAELTVRKATRDRFLRVTWADGSTLEVAFTARADRKSQVALLHRRLGSRAAAARARAFWGDRLAALAALLEPRPAAPRARSTPRSA